MSKYGTFVYGRSSPRHSNDQYNIFNSIKWHLENATFYDSQGVSLLTLPQKYPTLSIVVGFPDNMADIQLPTLSIDYVSSGKRQTMHLTRTVEDNQYVIDGFVGGSQGGQWNKANQLELMSDVKCLFDPETSGQDWIHLFDYTRGIPGARANIDTLQIKDVSSRFQPVGADETLDAVRFRFQVLVTLGLYKAQSAV